METQFSSIGETDLSPDCNCSHQAANPSSCQLSLPIKAEVALQAEGCKDRYWLQSLLLISREIKAGCRVGSRGMRRREEAQASLQVASHCGGRRRAETHPHGLVELRARSPT